VVIRENSEDLYAGIEFEEGKNDTLELISWIEKATGKKINKDSGISIKPISITATQRIVKFAFEYAKKYRRKKVTLVTKANIMKFTDGLFLKVGTEVAKQYPEFEFETILVDNLCMQLVKRPEQFDVLVLPNLYGDIVSDICAGLIGGLGVAPGANIGDEIAVFEAIHGSAPKYKGLNKVNPTAVILSGMLMLRYLGEERKADILEQAVANVIAEGKYVTYDFKVDRNDPTAVGTRQMGEAIIQQIRKLL
jgi:isocitrate dehydrogenase (NAD+)